MVGVSAVSPFNVESFSAQLRTRTLGRKIEWHESAASTMPLADTRARNEGTGAHGAIVIAESQTAGVGRRGRSWQSPLGNLYFSLLWIPTMPPGEGGVAMMPQLVRLNLAAGVAVVKASAAVGIDSALIKWPNDVWAGEPPRKMSGTILNFDGLGAANLGIGINVLEELAPNTTATSLSTLRDALPGALRPPPISREAVLAAFCYELERLMGLGTSEVLAEYSQHDLLRGRTIRVHHKTREEDDPKDFDATVLGVDTDGRLRVRPLGVAAAKGEVLLSGEEVSITPIIPHDGAVAAPPHGDEL